ncbi:MAG: TonB-dependent receptor, partial [Proteobacteria bacterium]|nr:TonB-dependent receptor [Pseudomonadota bacterium]
TQDDTIRSKATTLVYADLGYRVTDRISIGASVFNLLDAKSSDIDYFYASRLAGEPPAGVSDVHTHPSEPRELRIHVAATF